MTEEATKRFSFQVFREALKTFRPAFEGQRGPIVLAGVLTAASILTDLLKPWPMKFIFDEVLAHQPGDPTPMDLSLVQLAVAATAAFLGISMLTGLISSRSSVVVSRVEMKVTIRIRRKVFEHLHRLGFPFHQSVRTGDLLQRLMGDVGGVRRLIFSSWVSLIERVVVVVATSVVMFALDPLFALLALLPLPFHAVSSSRFSARFKKFTRRQRKRESNASAVAIESFQQIRLVKAYAAEERAADLFAEEAESGEEDAHQAARMSARFGLLTDVVNAAGIGTVLLVGALRVLAGALTPGELLVLVTYARSLYRPVSKMSADGGRLASASVSAERLLEVLKIEPEDPKVGVPAPRFAGELAFQDVEYQHPDGVKALKGVSFVVPRGCLALMQGPNGSGKSTSLSVILRLVTPQAGTLLIDGRPASEYQLDSYRKNFAYVPQDTHLFGASIRENVLYGRADATQEELDQAAKVALLDEVIARLPGGWDEHLGEGGTTLSGGEARRLMLARAAIRDARILLFDEPLTGLDVGARALVAQAIRRIAAGRTTLVVSHGPASELEPDLIIHLEDGRCLKGQEPEATSGPSSPAEDVLYPAGDLARLMSNDSALALFRETGMELISVERDFTRVRQRGTFVHTKGALIAFRFRARTPDGSEMVLPGYVRTFIEGETEELERLSRLPSDETPLGPGIRFLSGGRSVLFLFPNDAKLPGLNAVHDDANLGELLSQLEVFNSNGLRIRSAESVFIPVRYRPERRFITRAILKVSNGTDEDNQLEVFMRYFPDDRGKRIYETTEALRCEGNFPYVPAPLGYLMEGKLFVEEIVKAKEFTPSLLAHRVSPQLLAERVLRLHGTPVKVENQIKLSDIRDGLTRSLNKISRDPKLAPLCERLNEGLLRSVPLESPSVLIHGDLHPDQILIADEGPMFVDFERSGMGDPYQDLGNLVSHLLRLASWKPDLRAHLIGFTESLIHAYSSANGGRDPRDLRFYVGRSLVVRARAAFRRQEPNWPVQVNRSLELASEVLGVGRDRTAMSLLEGRP